MKTALILFALHLGISTIALSLFGALMLAKLTLHPKTFGRFLSEDMPSRNLVAMWLFFPVLNVLGAFMILSILIADLWIGRHEIYKWARDKGEHTYPLVHFYKYESKYAAISLSDAEKKQLDNAKIPRCKEGCTVGHYLADSKCIVCKDDVKVRGE